MKLSLDKIRTELRNMDATIAKDLSTNREIHIPAMRNRIQSTIYKVLGIGQNE